MNEAVAGLVDDYVEQHAKFAFQEFNVLRVAQDQVETADRLDVDSPLAPKKLQYRGLIREEIGAVKREYQQQFRSVFEYVTDPELALDDGLELALRHDPVLDIVTDERRDALRGDLAAYLRRVAETFEPLLVAEGDDAWDVVTRVCGDREEARERLGTIAEHSDVYRPYADDLEASIDLTGLELFDGVVDYSDEMLRIVEHGEDYIRHVIASDVDDAFDAA